jgi:6-phosphofructokinase
MDERASDDVFAILVGGGPAPGINSVIGAATIRGILGGARILGIPDGFRWLMEGDTSRVKELTVEDVSRLHFRGGSHLRTSRANPTKNAAHLEKVVESLLGLNVSGLITVGGDDTCFSAMKVEEKAAGRLRVVHVPKTIDNDLDLPHGIPTFGFQTARHIGVGLVRNLMVDAQTTEHWYFVVAMGRKAGHLALAIGKSASATLSLISEEFPERPVAVKKLADILAGSVIKRTAAGRPYGVVILAEGLGEILDPEEIEELGAVALDEHGHMRLDELNLGEILKRETLKQLEPYHIKPTIVAKNVGYELRCADPIPFDMEYTRDLGASAAKYLLEGGNAAMVAIVNGHFTPLPFSDMLDPETGRTRVRMVDSHSESYEIARDYMIRLNASDFQQADTLRRYAAVIGMAPEEFRARFEYVTAHEKRT